MEHAGATFLRESSVIFPTEPTKNDQISRANLIFHETAHQWFGDTVTMKWFDDLWLKEGFAEFMAYKTLEKVMPEANAWKVFYERNKQAAYLTDSTKGHHADLPGDRQPLRRKKRLRQHRLSQSPVVPAPGRVLPRRRQIPNRRPRVFEEARVCECGLGRSGEGV